MNILIINGFGSYTITSSITKEIYGEYGKGKLTKSICDIVKKILLDYGHQITETNVDLPYNIVEEQNKILNSDLVFIQFPIYWYERPAKLKEYFDNVYEIGVLTNADGVKYGDYGLMKNKKSILSVTLAAPKTAYNEGQFLENLTIEDILLPVTLSQKFIGFDCLPIIEFTDVFDDFNIDEIEIKLNSYFKLHSII